MTRKRAVNFVGGRSIVRKKNYCSLRVNRRDFLAKVGFSIKRKNEPVA